MAAEFAPVCANRAEQIVHVVKIMSMPRVEMRKRGRLPMRSVRNAEVRAIPKFQMLRIPLIRACVPLLVIPMLSRILARSVHIGLDFDSFETREYTYNKIQDRCPTIVRMCP